VRVRAAALATAAALAGCYTIRYERRAVAEDGEPRENWHHGLVNGFFEVSGPVRLDQICPGGAAEVENQVTFANGVGQVLTTVPGFRVVNVWSPTTVRVRCARPSGPVRKLKVVLVPLATLAGVDERTARVFDEALAGELRRHAGVSVVTPSDVAALLGVEHQRQMLGCAESGCIAELGGALGADRVIRGSVGRVGDSLVVNIASLDPKRASQAASVSRRLKGAGDEALLDALPVLVEALLAEPPARTPAPVSTE